jgi:hypothetical protein
MTPDAFSAQRRHGPPLALDPIRTAVIVVDRVNELFEPGGQMVLAGGTALYAPVHALVDAAEGVLQVLMLGERHHLTSW